MIHNVQTTGRKIKVRPSQRLRDYFVSLARQVMNWRQSTDLPESGGTTIGVTSLHQNSGCSVVALNLAASLAELDQGNVLLVKADFADDPKKRRSVRTGHGLTELLIGQAALTECIRPTTTDHLFVLGSGRLPAREAVGLPFESLSSINAELSSTFPYVVFDLPIANEMTACLPIAQSLDGILIVNSPKIEESKLNRMIGRFRSLPVPVIGLVLNKA